MPGRSARWMAAGQNALWIAVEDEARGIRVGRWSDGAIGNLESFGNALGGWDATVDSEDVAWVVWSDQVGGEAEVFARRGVGAEWGPRLQVSVGDVNTQPSVTPDEYGNVWILWHRSPTDELWMCRMGPRSGQETMVARGAASGAVSVVAVKGVLYVTYLDSEGALRTVEGTEHQGFKPPQPV